MGERSQPIIPNVGCILMVDEIHLCFLQASDVARGVGEEGVHIVFMGLVVEAPSVPVRDVDDQIYHRGDEDDVWG